MSEQWGFRLMQDGMVVAEGEGDKDSVRREGMHYAMVYGQDGPCTLIVAPLPLPKEPGNEWPYRPNCCAGAVASLRELLAMQESALRRTPAEIGAALRARQAEKDE